MHFAFTSDQLQIRDSVRSMLASECPPAVVRAGAQEVWAQLAALGVLGINLPEEVGGLGMGPVEWVLLCEEAGRAALPLPLTETLALNPALTEAGLHELAAAVATGEKQVTVGTTHYVDADRVAQIFTWQDEQLLTIDAPSCTPVTSVSAQRRIFTVTGSLRPLPGHAGALRDRLLVGTAAELLGLAERQLELAVAYSKERQQFGKAIGSFQAIQHHLSNALLALSFAKPVVYRAAWSLAEGDPEASIHAAMAKAQASDAAYTVRRLALQVHGAIGYSLEYDLHLWMKRSMALEAAWGNAGFHRARIAEAFELPSL